MKIAVIAAGNVGSTLGRAFHKLGHEVVFGVRNPNDVKFGELRLDLGDNSVTTIADAVKQAEVVVLTTPWEGVREAIEAAGNLSGKTVIDAINPVSLGSDIIEKGLLVGHTTSAAEQIASWAPGAHVVKAFNTTGWENMKNAGRYQQKPSLFLCGDNPDAKNKVMALAQGIGFEPVDCGALNIARLLEPTAMLWIHLAFALGKGTDIAFRLMEKTA